MGFAGLFYPWGFLLQAVAIVHFVRRRPDTYWLWVIFLGGAIGALIYIAAEVIPDVSLLRRSLNRVSNRRKIRDLEALVVQNPAVGNYEELADLCFDDGQFARARELYDHVIAKRPDSIDAYYRRGMSELATNDVAAALADLERVVAQDPKYDFHRAIGLLAHANALAGNVDRADALFKAATGVSTLSETSYNYAAFHASEKRTADARAWAERILATKASMPRYLRRRERPWFQRAAALMKKLK